MRPYRCDASFVVPCENQARPPDSSFFQHLICFFARALKICTPLNCPPEQVVQTHAWDAHSVFQNVNSLLDVEASHLFQNLKAGRHIEIVVVMQPVWEGAHPLFFEQLLAPLPLFPRENVFTLQLQIPVLVFWEPRLIKLFGGVKPFVGEPGFHCPASVGFHPFVIPRPRAKVVDDIEETGPPGEQVHGFVPLLGHFDFF